MADDPGEGMGVSLRPTREYSYRVGTELLPPASSFSPGAFQNRDQEKMILPYLNAQIAAAESKNQT